jgi:hypothetical protein
MPRKLDLWCFTWYVGTWASASAMQSTAWWWRVLEPKSNERKERTSPAYPSEYFPHIHTCLLPDAFLPLSYPVCITSKCWDIRWCNSSLLPKISTCDWNPPIQHIIAKRKPRTFLAIQYSDSGSEVITTGKPTPYSQENTDASQMESEKWWCSAIASPEQEKTVVSVPWHQSSTRSLKTRRDVHEQ